MSSMQSRGVAGTSCPHCGTVLQHRFRGELAVWECSQGHGVGVDIIEASGELQQDELEAIWEGSKTAPPSKLISPISGKPMVEVTFWADDDTESGNIGYNAQKITIEVDPENYFGWFSLEEIVAMPKETAEASAASKGLVGLAQLDREEEKFDDIFDDAEDYRGSDESDGRLDGFLGGLSRRLRS